MEQQPAVRLQPPPAAVVRLVNPLVRRLLSSPLAGQMPAPMALLEFRGRRTGRRLAVPVGLHELASGPVVFTEAGWRHNFADGAEVVVRRGGRLRRGRGVLVEDAEAVADALVEAVALVGPRNLALRTAPGHTVTRADLRGLGRGMLRLELDG